MPCQILRTKERQGRKKERRKGEKKRKFWMRGRKVERRRGIEKKDGKGTKRGRNKRSRNDE